MLKNEKEKGRKVYTIVVKTNRFGNEGERDEEKASGEQENTLYVDMDELFGRETI